jgi:hypothetical protein
MYMGIEGNASADWLKSYNEEFEKQLEVFGLENKGLTFYFKYLNHGRRGFSPYGENAVYIDATGGLPAMPDFRIQARHELWHKRKELKRKKERFYDEIMANLAGRFDFVVTGKLPSPLEYLNGALARGKKLHGSKV